MLPAEVFIGLQGICQRLLLEPEQVGGVQQDALGIVFNGMVPVARNHRLLECLLDLR
jgi:hypothetical protein